MGEKASSNQRMFPQLKDHLPGSTHFIHPGAVLRVKTKTASYFATADLLTEMEAVKQEEEPVHYPNMIYLLAMTAFSVYYMKHDKKVDYSAGTPFFAYKPRRDYDLVEKIPADRKKRIEKKGK